MALDPRRVLTFRAVAHAGSFSRAAETLALTQPAVSQQVAALERQLGTRLLDRGPGSAFAVTEAGELLLRGPSLMAGYANLPEATAETLRDGLLHTGDLVRRDHDGYLYFVDRAKDMIKTGGENVYSAEVERIGIADMAEGADAAQIGQQRCRRRARLRQVVDDLGLRL